MTSRFGRYFLGVASAAINLMLPKMTYNTFGEPISRRPIIRKRRSGWLYGSGRESGQREKDRRVRQGAHFRQRLSHKPGTVQPRHIFGGER